MVKLGAFFDIFVCLALAMAFGVHSRYVVSSLGSLQKIISHCQEAFIAFLFMSPAIGAIQAIRKKDHSLINAFIFTTVRENEKLYSGWETSLSMSLGLQKIKLEVKFGI